MANRGIRRNISGPHSALTDFLASHNISAAAIRSNYQQRLNANNANNTAVDAAEAANDNGNDNDTQDQNQDPARDQHQDEGEGEDEAANDLETQISTRTRKRKRETATATATAAAKAKAKAKARAGRNGDGDDDDYDELGDLMYQKSRPVPGQIDNCDICNKRFTVTPYSKTGPDGGLLCTKCSKQLARDEDKAKPKARKVTKKGRRQNFSNLLDGIAQRGAFSLLEMCIKKVADNINDIEEFGDLPQELLHRLSQILSKRRVMTPRTLELFLRNDVNMIEIYDAAKLETEDFQKVFAMMPLLEKVNFRFAGQFKDEVLDYVSERESRIKALQLDACNLISDECWQRYFQKHGSKLESLKLSNLDCSLNDATMAQIAAHCPNLRRLKLKECWKLGDASLKSIAKLTKLEHLSLKYVQEPSKENVVGMVENVGPKLKTLSLQGFKQADDEVLDAIYFRCRQLTKLRFTDNSLCTDRGFARLFSPSWPNPGLTFVDVSGTRHVDNNQPDGPEDEPVGFGQEGLRALMAHSGEELARLNISSCRHVSYDGFQAVFSAEKAGRKYGGLREVDVSFHTGVDDYLMGSIFQACPGLNKVIAFACFNVRDVRVPAGVAMIGGMNAHSSIATNNVEEA